MLFGGLFLLFKATVELNERLEGKDSDNPIQRKGAQFWGVVAQIVVLDAIFSLDSVITAVGMVDHLAVMMAAVVIAMSLMLLASKALTRFVNSHPTIVILCLSFLLMIGFSLIAEGFGFPIPKGYLYAAIGFSVIIESLNQLALFNRRRFLSANLTLRQRTTEAVMNLLSGHKENAELNTDTAALIVNQEDAPLFNPQERRMIERVLNLNQRTVSSIMTSRHDIEHIDLSAPEDEIRALLEKNQHTRPWSPVVKMMKICLASSTLSTFCNSRCAMNRSICMFCYVSRWCSRKRCPCCRRWSSFAMPGPILPSWWMNLAPLKGW